MDLTVIKATNMEAMMIMATVMTTATSHLQGTTSTNPKMTKHTDTTDGLNPL